MSKPTSIHRVIPQNKIVSILNRWDETREFVLTMWHNNPILAKQGGSKVAVLLGSNGDMNVASHHS